MFDSAILPVAPTPFPHVVKDGFLDCDAYRTIAASFPACPANSGPTGFSVFQDDPTFAALLERVPAWRALFERTQSQAFVDHVLAQFPSVCGAGTSVDLAGARFAAHVESRADKERRHLPPTGLAPDDLWVRFDILQGNVGYKRAPHTDHRRRAASMLIYFCDAAENEMLGGDLVLHDADGREAATVRPRHNRMVLFPCHNASVHSVSTILAQSAPRNFVQITVSSSVDLWPTPPVGIATRLREKAAALRARVARRL